MLENQNDFLFHCHFVENSAARGCLAISKQVLIIDNTEPQFSYKIAYKITDNKLIATSRLQELSPGENKILFYEMEENGLPAKHPALYMNVTIPLTPTANEYKV